MKKRIAWAVIEESAVGGCHDITVTLFEEKKDAVAEYMKISSAWKNGCKSWKRAGRGYHTEMWRDGYYDEDHVVVDLEKKEIRRPSAAA